MNFLSSIFNILRQHCPLHHLHVTAALLPESAQASDIVLGAALTAALPGHTQRKVPLHLARYVPVPSGWVPVLLT